VQRRGDGAYFDAERLGDRRVVEVEVEAKEESVALSLGKPTQRRADILVGCLRSRTWDVRLFVELLVADRLARIDGGVEDAAADPRLE